MGWRWPTPGGAPRRAIGLRDYQKADRVPSVVRNGSVLSTREFSSSEIERFSRAILSSPSLKGMSNREFAEALRAHTGWPIKECVDLIYTLSFEPASLKLSCLQAIAEVTDCQIAVHIRHRI